VVAANEHGSRFVGQRDQSIDHRARARPAVDVISEEHNGVLRRRRQLPQEGRQGRVASVDVAYRQNAHSRRPLSFSEYLSPRTGIAVAQGGVLARPGPPPATDKVLVSSRSQKRLDSRPAAHSTSVVNQLRYAFRAESENLFSI
jgi:hypothetical protein